MAGIVYAVFVFGAQIKHTVTWGMLIGLSANLKVGVYFGRDRLIFYGYV